MSLRPRQVVALKDVYCKSRQAPPSGRAPHLVERQGVDTWPGVVVDDPQRGPDTNEQIHVLRNSFGIASERVPVGRNCFGNASKIDSCDAGSNLESFPKQLRPAGARPEAISKQL